jgi:hypothetical protein
VIPGGPATPEKANAVTWECGAPARHDLPRPPNLGGTIAVVDVLAPAETTSGPTSLFRLGTPLKSKRVRLVNFMFTLNHQSLRIADVGLVKIEGGRCVTPQSSGSWRRVEENASTSALCSSLFILLRKNSLLPSKPRSRSRKKGVSLPAYTPWHPPGVEFSERA